MTEVAPRAGNEGLAGMLAIPALVGGAVAMGISPVFVREADVGPFASAFWRMALALPPLLAWALAEGGLAGLRRAAATPAVWFAGLFFAGDLFFWHLAITYTTVANATFMATLAPVWVVLFSRLVIGETVDKTVFAGLGISLVGAACLLGGNYRLSPDHLVGDLYGLVTSFFFGMFFLSVRVARRSVGSGALSILSGSVTCVILFLVAVPLEPTMLPASLSGLGALVALGLLSQVGGQGLLAYALGHLSAAFSSVVIFLEALAAAFFGWLLLGEGLRGDQMAGGALILVGIWFARPRRPAPQMA
ncbi:carboxylate/amino acid/amine transporter [Hartmannibacter diazotrophicus]|uniref:Carboxylate/amino acid/amine transporter n=1 Tax=Hartmannibacter diazotrophicus TaxID=1482074 RepID=A0A2C9DAB1_9HYPH|nr:DMT family transporter [Hartmannibacter diazotrophicus]SON57227.1 carboxylate/amino acid/amine transporter [Hartmannibacter diazotrophicus]